MLHRPFIPCHPAQCIGLYLSADTLKASLHAKLFHSHSQRSSPRSAPSPSQRVNSVFPVAHTKTIKATLSHLTSSCLYVALSVSSKIHPAFGHVSSLLYPLPILSHRSTLSVPPATLYPSVSPSQPHDSLQQIGPTPTLNTPATLSAPLEVTLHSAPSFYPLLMLTSFFGLWKKHSSLLTFQSVGSVIFPKHLFLSPFFFMPEIGVLLVVFLLAC